ncbi:MAG: hypothetical protein GF398_17155 [Chitinivibrionales bacterium]|nr:hypothetical protein [Chitinivibrionales bacterium]
MRASLIQRKRLSAVFRLAAPLIAVCLIHSVSAYNDLPIEYSYDPVDGNGTPMPLGNTDAVLYEHVLDFGFGYNHNTTNVTLENGDVLIAWIGHSGGEGETGACRITRWDKSSDTYSDPWTADVPGAANYTLYRPRKSGAPLLMFSCDNFSGGDSYVSTSTDDGVTWTSHDFPSSAEDIDNPTWPGFPLEIPADATGTDYPAHTLLKPAGNEFHGGLYIIPPDNYTGQSGSSWSNDMFTSRAAIYSILVPDAPDYSTMVALGRPGVHSSFEMYKSTNGGQSWGSNYSPNLGGTLCDACSDGAKTGIFGVSLDLYDGPRRGWHVVAGTSGYTGLGRHFTRIYGTQDIDGSWDPLLEIGYTDGENA